MHTYEEAHASFRNTISQQIKPNMRQHSNLNVHRMNEASRAPAKNQNRRGGHGRGGKGICTSRPNKTCPDSTHITLNAGQVIECHPSSRFPPHIWNKMSQLDKHRLKSDQLAYKQKHSLTDKFNNSNTRYRT